MTARWITADVFEGLASLEDGSVDLVVTSPPFLALRSYLPADHEHKHKEIGSEATPAEWLDVLLRVTAELRRVLAPHGSICIELGDTYAGSFGSGDQRTHDANGGKSLVQRGGFQPIYRNLSEWPLAKSRTLIPQLYEIALAYGINPLTGTQSPAGQWLIRNVVTWARPNPPVGALGDKWRPATSDLIVACTSPKRYWDDLATRRRNARTDEVRLMPTKQADGDWQAGNRGAYKQVGDPTLNHPSGAPLLDYWEIPLLEGEEPKQYGPKPPKPKGMSRHREGEPPRTDLPSQQRDGNWRTLPQTNDDPNGPGAPLLDYWEIPPGGYKGSHYAVFPEELVVPCVKAMCPPKVCRVCGEPSRRIVEVDYIQKNGQSVPDDDLWRSKFKGRGVPAMGVSGSATLHAKTPAKRVVTDSQWTDCGHDDYRPGLILDPFAGSGTTLSVATGHGHDAIGIDLDPRNADLARDRIGPFLFEETRML